MMYSGSSTIKLEQEQDSGRISGLEGLKVIMQLLSPAACCLLQPFLHINCWQFLQIPLTYGNGTNQPHKVEGIKSSVYPKSFWSRSKSSWIAEASVLCGVMQGMPVAWPRKKNKLSRLHRGNCFAHELGVVRYELESLWVRSSLN